MKLKFKYLLFAIISISLLSFSNNAAAQQYFYYDVAPLNGNYAYTYNQVPGNLVGVVPGIAGASFQWEQSIRPLDGFTAIPGATLSAYTFTAPLTQTTYYRRKLTVSGSSIYSNALQLELVSVNWENVNYIREHDVLISNVANWQAIDNLPIGQKLQTTSYLDGLGRPLQKISRETATPPTDPNNLWGDAVKFYKYDALGRQTVSYLPYTTTTETGKYKTNPVTGQTAYYSSVYNETSAFSTPTYDNSPLNRVLNVKSPGTSWAAGPGNSSAYQLNDAAENVQLFNIDYAVGAVPVSAGAYPANTLYKMVSTDEKGKQVIEYINKIGQAVLTKTQIDDNPSAAHAGWICTYSIYDGFGLLRYRLQPEAVKWLDANGWNFAAANGPQVLNELCFRYDYDEKGRTILKKAPGAKVLNMLYDKRDRVVFMQDGNQSVLPTPQWTANLYDDLDRIAITCLYNTAKALPALQADIDAAASGNINTIISGQAITDLVINNRNQITPPNVTAQNSITFVADATNNFETILGDNITAYIDPAAAGGPATESTFLYANPIAQADFTNAAVTTILKYNYYDNYTYTGAKLFNTNFDNLQAYPSGGEPIATTQRTLNMPTGSRVRVLNSTTFLTGTVYYDDKGRTIQATEDNIKTGTDVTTMQYQWDGRELSSNSKHSTANTGYMGFSIITKNIFDKIGRVTSIQKKYGSNAFKTIANYAFDDMGRLKNKKLDPDYVNTTTGTTGLETLAYSYNIHNEITGINKDYALKTPGLYNKWGNYFGLYLGYDNKDNVFTTAQLDGHVTGLLWNTQGDDAQRRYDFTYDNAGRLTNAFFKERQTTAAAWDNAKMDFSVTGSNGKIEYDLNGNLLTMVQKGILPGAAAPYNIDNLQYSYASLSNKLMKVTDVGTLATANGKLGDFADGTNTGDDYVYDDNGNLIIDLNKNATPNPGNAGGIKYNFLDKPYEVHIAGKGIITMVYDADGNKLQKIFTPEAGGTAKTTTYINEFIYEGNVLQYINFEEGRVRVMQTVSQNNGFDILSIDGNIDLPVSPPTGGGRGAFDYFLRDYQGNVRMILTEETHLGSNSCTMETARAANEEPIFGQVDANGVPTAANEIKARFDVNSIPGQGSGGGWQNPAINSYVSRLGNLAGSKMGPNALLKVMGGDKVSATTIYYYQNAVVNNAGSNTLLTSLLQSLTNAITGSAVTPGTVKTAAGNITTQLGGSNPFITATSPHAGSSAGNAPRAYLTVLFFDERFNFVEENSQALRVTQSGNNAPALVLANIKAPKNGYAYVYISNEADEMVYFDNLQVTHERARLIEENHYYAYGLKIAGISSRKLPDAAEAHIKNEYLYNDKELIDDADLNWYDYGFRSYDAQIGRFTQLDPLTDDYPELTNYQYASCEPIANIDMDGLEKLSAIGAATNKAAGFSNGVSKAFTVANVASIGINTGKVLSSIARQKIGEKIIEDALVKEVITPAVGGAALFVFLIFSPDFDTWGQTKSEFYHLEVQPDGSIKCVPGYGPISYLPVTNPLYNPGKIQGPKPAPPKTPRKQDRLYEQYVLIAKEEGDFDIMVRGQKEPQGKVHLKKEDVWKYGTTVNPERRYTQKWLKEKKLRKVRQTEGTKAKVLIDEKEKIIKYREVNGVLPPGNKQTN
jgi:RHS repeat-associated protein